MKAYVICFVATLLFTIFAEICFKKDRKKLGLICIISAIFVLAFIACAREDSVGRDIGYYVKPMIKRVTSSTNFVSYFNAANHIEIGYRVFMYIVVSINEDIHFSLFCIQLIPCICVFIFAYKFKDKVSMTLVIITYLLVWYLRSYTIMRQSIAIGFIMLGFISFYEKKKIGTIIFSLIAISFHSSAVVGLALYVFWYVYSNKNLSNKERIVITFSALVILSVVVVNFERITLLLCDLGVLSKKYYSYMVGEQMKEEITIMSPSELVARIVFLAIATVGIVSNSAKAKNKKDGDFSFFYIILVIEFILYLISFKLSNAERISYYYRYIGMLYCMPAFTNSFKVDRLNRFFTKIVIIMTMFAFWYWKYPIQKNCETYPYKSDIVQFLN